MSDDLQMHPRGNPPHLSWLTRHRRIAVDAIDVALLVVMLLIGVWWREWTPGDAIVCGGAFLLGGLTCRFVESSPEL